MADKTAVRRRLIGTAMRQYRESFGYTLAEVGELLECHASKVSRIEGGQRGIRAKELRELLDIYGVREHEQDLLLAVEESTRGIRPTWWQGYTMLLPGPLLEAIVLEEYVSHIQAYAPTVIPPLLQTYDYAYAAALGDPSQPEGTEEDRAQAVLVRQEATLLSRRAPLHVILGEAALRQYVGDAAILQDQLQHLIKIADEVLQITVQVLPFKAEAAPGNCCGPYSILHFPAALDLRLIHLDGPAGGVIFDDPDTVAACAYAYTRLQQAALTPKTSLEAIQRLIKK